MRLLCHHNCHAVRHKASLDPSSAIEGFGSLSICTPSSLSNQSYLLRQDWMLTPPYNSPISSCIGAVSPAEPPSRDTEPWGLGQSWTKIRAITSRILFLSLYRRFLSAFLSVTILLSSSQLNDLNISPNNSLLNSLLTLSRFARHSSFAPVWEKRK